MSFNFEWPSPFSPSFHAQALSLLTSALNRGPKPKVIADDIEVTELNMGSVPPDLEILEIGELGRERFRGIFRLTYAGDAHVVVRTRVQVNPLSGGAATSDPTTPNAAEETFTPFASGRGILFAATPLIVPMRLTLSHVRLRAIIVLVVSKTKGITLVFKNDPLESVQVSSTFDSVAVVAKYLQQEIEGQLKEVFREDLPGIIHRLSQTWLSSRNKATEERQNGGADGHADTPKRSEQAGSTRARKKSNAASAAPTQPPKASSSKSPATPASPKRPPSAPATSSAPASSAAASRSSAKQTRPRAPSPTEDIPPPLSDYYQEGPESYDPTYGLREDEVRVPKDGRGFKGLKGLRRNAAEGLGFGAAAGRGLGGLLDDDEEEEDEVQEEEVQGQEEQEDEDVRQEESAADDHEQGDAVEPKDEGESEQEGDDPGDDVEDEDEEQEDDPQEDDPQAVTANDDFSRFGYPPPDAEFNSEAFELASLAPRSVFDDDQSLPSRNKTIRARRSGPGSTRSAGNASTAAQRVNARRAVEEHHSPPTTRHATPSASSLLMPGLARSNSSSSSSILSGRSPLLASTGPSSIGSRRTSPAHSGNLTPASSSSSRPPSRPRPRVFHSSSLLQLYQPSSDGIDNGDETTSSSWGNGSATIRGPRSSRLSGGGASTLRPPRSEGSRSVFMDSTNSAASDASPAASRAKARRTFQMGSKAEGKKKQEEEAQPSRSALDQQYYQMSLSEDDEEDDEEEEEQPSEASRDDSDDVDDHDQSHSRTHSLSNSGASGTLATLEPEPMASDYNSQWGGSRVRR